MLPSDIHEIMRSITGITLDSRDVKAGYLFAALPGSKVNGVDFIDSAIRAGATTILCPTGATPRDGMTMIESDNPRKTLSEICALYYKVQPNFIAAVTGTNGKTSVVTFAENLWKALGEKAQSLGTLSGNLTTPDVVTLHQTVQGIEESGITHLALEASSHGLDQYRLNSLKVKAAGFTNLTRDHLDYHKTMEAYLEAKSKLFSEVLEEDGIAVINADIPEFEHLSAIVIERGLTLLDYGFNAKSLKLKSLNPTPTGTHIEVQIMGEDYNLEIPLVGAFQIMNLLCALGLVIAEDVNNAERTKTLVNMLPNIKGVRGRVELVSGHPSGAGVYVDYAHTPDAIETVLKALRPHTRGKLICLFGCGGDRDAGKRPLMAQAAAKFSDIAILTDDNPRGEDPAIIRKQAQAGAPEVLNIGGRYNAIEKGIELLERGDVFAITGKGHEQGIKYKDHIEPFDDVQEASKAIEKIKEAIKET